MDQFETAVFLADMASTLDGLNKQILPAHLVQRLDQLVDSLHNLAADLAGPRADEIYCNDDTPITGELLALMTMQLQHMEKETLH